MSVLAVTDIPGISAQIQAIQARLLALRPSTPGGTDTGPARTSLPTGQRASASGTPAAGSATTPGRGTTAPAGASPAAVTVPFRAVPFATALSGALDQVAGGGATAPARSVPVTVPPAGGVSIPAGRTATGSGIATGSAASGSAGVVTGDSVVADARRYLGVPYVWGGETPQGLDCSGLVQLTFHDLGISLPRVAADQARQGTEIPSLAQARPGDLLAFGSPAHHIAIYLGDNKLLEAPEPGKDVQITDVYRTPTTIRRIVPAGGDAGASAAGPVAAPVPASGIAGTLAATSGVPRAVPWSTIALPTTPVLGAPWAGPATSPATGTTGLPPASSAVAPATAIGATAVAAAGGRTAAQLMAAGLSSAVAAYAGQFAAAESRFGLPSGILAAVAQQESGGDPGAVSPAGAQGLMQLMPSTAGALGVGDPFDPRQAIPGAARLLAEGMDRFGGSVPRALAAYNAGSAAVARYGGVPPYRETQDYVRSVTDMLARLA